MAAAIAHRGPDAEGFHFDGPVGPRPPAAQHHRSQRTGPAADVHRRWSVRHRLQRRGLQLRRVAQELESQRHRFRRRTPTPKCCWRSSARRRGVAERFNGMFAFAIWDRLDAQAVHRTRPGRHQAALLRLTPRHAGLRVRGQGALRVPGIRSEVDRSQVDTFMTFGYVPGEQTIFRGVRKLLPGHSMTVTWQTEPRSGVWDVRLCARSPGAARPRRGRGASRPASRFRADPSPQRRAGRRLPERGPRLQRRWSACSPRTASPTSRRSRSRTAEGAAYDES